MAVADRRARDGAVVVLFDPIEQEILPGARGGDRLEHFIIPVEMVVPGDDQRHIHRCQHGLHEFDCLLGRAVAFFGMGAFEADADQVGTVLLNADLRHLRWVLEQVAIDLPQHTRVLLADEVKHLHCDERPIGHFAFPEMERHGSGAADAVGASAGASLRA